MPADRSSKQNRAIRDGRGLLDALDAAETKRLLVAMLDAHPELVAEVAGLADEELRAVSVEDVAEDVAFELGLLQVEEIWERSGTQPDGGYVDPIEAASELVEEAVAPFLTDLARRAELGRSAEATVLCQGTLLGLYRISQREGEFLGGHGSDSLEEASALAIEAWKKGGTGSSTTGARAKEWAAMGRFVSEALPKWRPFLARTLGRSPTWG